MPFHTLKKKNNPLKFKFSQQKKKLVLLAVSLLIPIIFVSSIFILYRYFYNSIETEASKNQIIKSDVIVIFGAAIAYRGRPSLILKMRIMQGLKLYKNGFSKYFILTGGVGWAPPAESVVMKNILLKNGIPEKNIFLETKSKSTKSQVSYAISIIKKQKWKNALLVSDPIHMYRIKKYFSYSGIQAYSAPVRNIHLSKKKTHIYIKMEILKLISYYLFD